MFGATAIATPDRPTPSGSSHIAPRRSDQSPNSGWTSDEEAAAVIRARRARAGIPDDQRHRPKWRLALDMLAELADWGLTPPVVVADAGYGTNAQFREQLTAHGWPYVCQVTGDLTAHRLDAVPELVGFCGLGPHPKPRYRTRAVGLREHVLAAGRDAAVKVTWREGSRGPMTSTFVALQVCPAGRRPTGRLAADGSLTAVWLLAEWPPEAAEPTDYWLATLPEDTGLAELVRLAKIRWRIEHDYRELKTGLGLDHFEGPRLHRLAPARHPGHRRPAVPHRTAQRPKSGCAGLSLYAVLHEPQAPLSTWTDTCTVCGHRIDSHARAPT